MDSELSGSANQETPELQIASYDANVWRPTPAQYAALQWLFDHFNAKLFGGELPPVVLTLSRKGKRTVGYYQSSRWDDWENGKTYAEICLSSDHLFYDGAERDWRDIFATLVHEMVHHWEAVHARGASRGYHNQHWGAKMEELGLMPSDTGKPGGKRTGRNMSHYIVDGGLFDHAFALIPESRYLPLITSSRPPGDTKRTPSKLKYTCPVCGLNCWGAPGLKVLCGLHNAALVVALGFADPAPEYDATDDVTLERDESVPDDDPGWIEDEPAKQSVRVQRAWDVYEFLRDGPALKRDIREALGMTSAQIRQAIKDLSGSHMIVETKSGRWEALCHETERADQSQVPFGPHDIRL